MDWTLPASWTWAFCLFTLWLGAFIQRKQQKWWRSKTGRHYQKIGSAAERDAEKYLESQGFRVHDRQVRAGYPLWVDGREQPISICADLLVHDGQAVWVAEVKTGQRGRRLGYGGTRRQLLEYQLAFGVAGVLLVDPIRGRLDRIRFPFGAGACAQPQRGSRATWWLLLAGCVLVWWWSQVS